MTTNSNGWPEDAAFGWLLDRLMRRVEGVREIALLSADGLVKTAVGGGGRDDSERFAATASGLVSLARAAGSAFDHSDKVRLVVIEMEASTLYAQGAGEGSVLAVLADRKTEASLVGHEMDELVKGVRGHLATPARPSPTGQGG